MSNILNYEEDREELREDELLVGKRSWRMEEKEEGSGRRRSMRKRRIQEEEREDEEGEEALEEKWKILGHF